MIDARGKAPPITAGDFPLIASRAGMCDPAPPESLSTPAPRLGSRAERTARRMAAEILASIQSRLPGRIREPKIRIKDDQFVLSGVSSSYYVKQIAQHVAMATLGAHGSGRLVNEIEVRALR
ncbi:MAG TPA: hypothetical protein VEQ85_07320 [Lacipirellulaceae bacterium]|nr:hypothetical protein [Lacipirellulaceae bacterium]